MEPWIAWLYLPSLNTKILIVFRDMSHFTNNVPAFLKWNIKRKPKKLHWSIGPMLQCNFQFAIAKHTRLCLCHQILLGHCLYFVKLWWWSQTSIFKRGVKIGNESDNPFLFYSIHVNPTFKAKSSFIVSKAWISRAGFVRSTWSWIKQFPMQWKPKELYYGKVWVWMYLCMGLSLIISATTKIYILRTLTVRKIETLPQWQNFHITEPFNKADIQ